MTTSRLATIQQDPGQRGAAMLVVATILVSLLAAGGIALYLQLQSTKNASLLKANRAALYCAEAGLIASRTTIAENTDDWPQALDAIATNDPAWYPLRGDLDNDGEDDYEVTLRDNDDEAGTVASVPTIDIDGRVFAVSRCLKNADVIGQVQELLVVQSSAGNVYRDQAGGGAFNAGNLND